MVTKRDVFHVVTIMLWPLLLRFAIKAYIVEGEAHHSTISRRIEINKNSSEGLSLLFVPSRVPVL